MAIHGSRLQAESPNTCQFCAVDTLDREVDAWDRPLLASPNFYVVPSLGALVEGWLLIVPRRHFISAAEIGDDLAEELWEITGLVRDLLAKHYGPVWLFEHGPATAMRSVGCGVDHAHVHLVPMVGDLIRTARAFLPHGVAFRAANFSSCRDEWRKGADYLFVDAPDARGAAAATAPSLGSQIFRKAIAELVGRPHQFDWKSDACVDNIYRTIDRVGADLLALQSTISVVSGL